MTTHPIWRTSGGSNARRGQGAKPLSSTPQLTMQSHASAGITASPVCTATGNVVLADMAGQIQLTDTTGKPIWQKTLSAGIQATPVIPEDEGCVYAACYNGMVYAIDLKTGEPLWQIEVPSQFDARILSDLLFLPQHHLLILSSWGYQYSAIDTQNHSIVHTWEAGSNLYAGATAAADETVFLLRAKWAREKANQAVELVQVDPQTGEETALHLVHPQEKAINFMKIASTPVLSGDEKTLFFVVNIDDHACMMAYSRENNAILWQKSIKRHILTTPTLRLDGNLVLTDLNGNVLIIEPEKGETLHTYHSNTYYILSSPVSDSAGVVYFGDIEGKIHAVQPDGQGQVIYTTGRCIQSRPAFDSAGRLLVPSMNGILHVLS